MTKLEGKSILVVGLGESGASCARASVANGAAVEVIDRSREPLRNDLVEELGALGVRITLGLEAPPSLETYDLVVASPGVPDRAPVLDASRSAGLEVISELELGYRLLAPGKMVAVTGTNGKTTTTMLLGEMLTSGGVRAVTCGNIGNPLACLCGKLDEDEVPVVEVSSFQLQNIDRFRAPVSIALNVTPDHFDWHADFKEYREAKMRLIENAEPGDLLVYNADDAWCREMAARMRGRSWGYSSGGAPGSVAWAERGWLVTGAPLPEGRMMPLDELRVRGTHNVGNVLAASLAAIELGVDREAVRRAASAFKGLEHRMEHVAKLRGVDFFNDSKATNPHAARCALVSFDEPLVMVMGGRNKGLDFGELASELCARMADGRVRGAVLMGESAPEMMRAIERDCGGTPRDAAVIAVDLDESVLEAYRLAAGEGAVVFSPACASFDMFSDYRERGAAFKQAVKRLERALGDGPADTGVEPGADG